MEKVSLPKEIADALDGVKQFYKSNADIIADIIESRVPLIPCGEHLLPLIKYSRKDAGNADILMSALINGYEIEQTPEERLHQYYEKLKMFTESTSFAPVGSYFSEMEGIKNTLDILGIKIEGVNG
jgi:hypothetical protein